MASVAVKPKIIVQEYINNLKNKFRVEKVIVFGSALKNKFNKNSDIDIIVLSNDFKGIDFLKRLELLSHARCGRGRQIPMDIIGYTPKEFYKLSKESIVLKEARHNGKVIWP